MPPLRKTALITRVCPNTETVRSKARAAALNVIPAPEEANNFVFINTSVTYALRSWKRRVIVDP